jgi:hypothetical protein
MGLGATLSIAVIWWKNTGDENESEARCLRIEA